MAARCGLLGKDCQEWVTRQGLLDMGCQARIIRHDGIINEIN